MTDHLNTIVTFYVFSEKYHLYLNANDIIFLCSLLNAIIV